MRRCSASNSGVPIDARTGVPRHDASAFGIVAAVTRVFGALIGCAIGLGIAHGDARRNADHPGARGQQ